MKVNFLKRYPDPPEHGLYGEMQAVPLKTLKNRFHIVAIDIIGYLTAYLIIRSYMGPGIRQMLWYLVLPVFFDILGLVFFYIWAYGSQKRDESYYNSTTYVIGGVLIYSFMYCDCVLIYHDISEILIFLLIPTVIACFYRDMRWFIYQAVAQGVFFTAFFMLRIADIPVHLTYVHPMLRILFFVLGIMQFSGMLMAQDRLRLKMLRVSHEFSVREEIQRTLAAKLNSECSVHINMIDKAADDIIKGEEDNEIVKYANHILEADDLLKKAISKADLPQNGGEQG